MALDEFMKKNCKGILEDIIEQIFKQSIGAFLKESILGFLKTFQADFIK